jgi:hypothetical protein
VIQSVGTKQGFEKKSAKKKKVIETQSEFTDLQINFNFVSNQMIHDSDPDLKESDQSSNFQKKKW